MAELIPDQPKDCTVSERIVFERLTRELDRDCIILHSLGLHNHETKIWGEADLVVLSTKGFFVLEVKGGKVACKDGVWTFGDLGSGKFYTKKEDPWTQASGAMFALRNRLDEADPRLAKLLIGFGVVMPMVEFTASGAEIELEVLFDRRDLRRSMGSYIDRLQKHWESVYQQRHRAVRLRPTREDILAARRILRPDVETCICLGSWLTGLESVFVQLTHDQLRSSRRMEANQRTIVRGKAGTGKTVIALDRAKRLAAQGRKVLFLCYNQLLAVHLREAMRGEAHSDLIEIRHVHAFYSDVIRKAGMGQQLANAQELPSFFTEVFPELFLEAAMEYGLPHYDVLIVDEAQDLMTPHHVDAFDFILGSAGLNRGAWHLFLDPQQNIYGKEISDSVEKRINEATPAYDDLYENCRNTRQIAVEGSVVSGVEFAIEGAPSGPSCLRIYYKHESEIPTLLDQVIEGWVGDGIQPGDIAVLSTLRRENSILASVGRLAGEPLVDVGVASVGDMVFSTMHAFKGLERKAVVAVHMAGIGDERVAMLHYAGLSRARMLLCLLVPESARATYTRQYEKFGAKLVG
ncbi:nuclease-related domain-containing DEAD/DEAH box helicase [Pseudomonas veronii]|uniref:nuclease-related domain-containing DEAD/DEAH box helicase n=1 Tax=Pseudomonas veronii TaxID=76761 RepID=UPI0015A2969A|nr:NERD domain-containing protein/DEAD/DEAH box helicase [Pseudomonas veronii]NWC60412.1 NERD domain-containing protein/DEAD/DEAH box helicase [Pseudomonas veronii]